LWGARSVEFWNTSNEAQQIVLVRLIFEGFSLHTCRPISNDAFYLEVQDAEADDFTLHILRLEASGRLVPMNTV